MTQEQIDKAVEKLISQANDKILERKAEYENSLSKATANALKNRTARSTIFQRIVKELKDSCEKDLTELQNALDESLNALYLEGETGGGSGGGEIEAPYEVDYSLPMRDRFVAVKNYYLEYEDYTLAYEDIKADTVAQDYLGEYYSHLVQMFKMMSIQET